MSYAVPDVPQSLRPIAHYVKIANEYMQRDVVIYYWCLFHAVQEGMKLDKSTPPALNFLTSVLSVLEQIKKENPGNDALTQDVVASAHIENHALKLFNYADSSDRNGTFNKNIVKAFYTSGHLFDVLTNFGEVDENTQSARKYAKWKATYIHNCLKSGETPVPGPPNSGEVSAPAPSEIGANPAAANQSVDFGLPMPPSGTDANQFGMPSPHTANGPFDPRPTYQQPPQPAPRSTSQPQPPHYPPMMHPMATPSSAPILQPSMPTVPSGSGAARNLTLEDFVEAKKYTKYALSALDYDDAKAAIDNMYKAIAILQKST